jgi:hypothetical protein
MQTLKAGAIRSLQQRVEAAEQQRQRLQEEQFKEQQQHQERMAFWQQRLDDAEQRASLREVQYDSWMQGERQSAALRLRQTEVG